MRGLVDRCPRCSSREVDGITRVTGYFSKVSGWNDGKVAELADRHRSKVE
jgi:ribonucleoside-triphosphate reductase